METYDFVYPKDSADINSSIDIAASVEGIEYDTIFPLVSALNDDSLFEFLRNENSRSARCS